jgi:phage shock protein PspC (stress-responsive transcriptional regulator)
VCSGLGQYWSTDPILLRLLFVVLFFGFGTGLLLYIIMWIVIPKAT